VRAAQDGQSGREDGDVHGCAMPRRRAGRHSGAHITIMMRACPATPGRHAAEDQRMRDRAVGQRPGHHRDVRRRTGSMAVRVPLVMLVLVVIVMVAVVGVQVCELAFYLAPLTYPWVLRGAVEGDTPFSHTFWAV